MKGAWCCSSVGRITADSAAVGGNTEADPVQMLFFHGCEAAPHSEERRVGVSDYCSDKHHRNRTCFLSEYSGKKSFLIRPPVLRRRSFAVYFRFVGLERSRDVVVMVAEIHVGFTLLLIDTVPVGHFRCLPLAVSITVKKCGYLKAGGYDCVVVCMYQLLVPFLSLG